MFGCSYIESVCGDRCLFFFSPHHINHKTMKELYYKNTSLENLFYTDPDGIVKEEQFKDIPNYEGCYQVSDLGRVKSVSRVVPRSYNGNINLKERILRSSEDGAGYLSVVFYGKSKCVHQLVSMAFLNHKPDGTHKICVDHVDNDRLNNMTDNLQLLTNRENCTKDKKKSTSNYIGVCRDKTRGKWLAQITIKGKGKYLGRFNKEIDASEAYQKELSRIECIRILTQ